MNRRSAEETRRVIMDAAFKIFSRSGYEGTSMRMIAGEAGISVGALYLYYEGKEELCLTLLRKLFNDFFIKMGSALEGVDDPVDQVRIYIQTYIKIAKKNRELIHAFNKEKGFAFGLELKQEFFSRLREFVCHIVKNGVERGVFTYQDEKEATRVIISVLRGYMLSMVIDPDNLFTPETCTDILLKGLVGKP